MQHLAKVVNRMIETEESDHVFITYGCDFAFTQAQVNYFFMDAVVKHWNAEHENIKLFYSTPARYLDALKKENAKYKQENVKMIKNMQVGHSSAQAGDEGAHGSQAQQTSNSGAQISKGFSIRRDDSFPYAQRPGKYWSGFYTTRPLFKKLMRTTSARFHSSLAQSSLQVLTDNNADFSSYIVG